MKTNRGEALETFILLSLPRYKSFQQQIKRAEDPVAEKAPEPLPPSLSEDIPPPIKTAKSDEAKTEPKLGKNLTKTYPNLLIAFITYSML